MTKKQKKGKRDYRFTTSTLHRCYQLRFRRIDVIFRLATVGDGPYPFFIYNAYTSTGGPEICESFGGETSVASIFFRFAA